MESGSAEMDNTCDLEVAAIVVACLAIVLCLVCWLTLCCFMLRLRSRLLVLERARKQQDHGLHNFEPMLTKHTRIQDYSEEPPPGSPGTKETLQLLSTDSRKLAPAGPAPAAPKYDNVGGDSHLLPASLRTTENLIIREPVGNTTSSSSRRPEQQQQQRILQVERSPEVQVKKPSPRPSPKTLAPQMPTPGYEVVPDPTGVGAAYEDIPDPRLTTIPRKAVVPMEKSASSDYYNPADALPEDFVKSESGSTSTAPQGVNSATLPNPKKMKIAEKKQGRHENDEYSDVFDSLPPGSEAEKVVGGVRSKRAMSDSSPNRTRTVNVKAAVGQDGALLEDDTGGGGGGIPCSLPAGNLDEIPELIERGDKLRQSKKDKEVVEFDPSKRKFRVSKNKNQDNKGNEYTNVTTINGRDVPDGSIGEGGGSREGSKTETKDESLLFECSEDGRREYAMVNKADKQKNRSHGFTSSNVSEGSGRPDHYSSEVTAKGD